MAKSDVRSQSRFVNGISDFQKEGAPDTYYFGRSIDHRTDPRGITLLPRTLKESGTVVTDLIKWFENVSGVVYSYGDAGNIYKRTAASVWSLLRSVSISNGNGLGYFAEDDYLYYTRDKLIGRYGPIAGTARFDDDFLGSQGGVPLNTASIQLLSASSQYASRADTASLSITGNIALEAELKPTTLPAAAASMTLVSKWDESGATRSYKFDIYGVSAYFGDGSDGALTISVDTTDTPIDSACTGTTATTALSATNASFAAGQIVLIHQSQGTGAGTWQRNKIASYTAGTITLESALNATYGTGAQVLVLKQYTNVTVNSGKTWTAKAWNGTVGGILAFLANGTLTVTGNIVANGCGFRGGASVGTAQNNAGKQGEGYSAVGGTQSENANGNGGGGGGQITVNGGGGGGGGNATVGAQNVTQSGGFGGGVYGSNDLTTSAFGGGGGGGGVGNTGGGVADGAGGIGGGWIFATSTTLIVTGTITANGATGGNSGGHGAGGGGGGGGGDILMKVQTATLGTGLVLASGGAGGTTGGDLPNGGAGGDGRIHLDYYTSYTGTTTPTINAAQDNSLVTNTTYQLRLALSSTGSNSEVLTKEATNLTTGVWQHAAVSWVASTKTATFYLNGVSLGSAIGTVVGAIHDNASTFQIGMYKDGAAAAAGFYNGLMDEVRVFNASRTQDQFVAGNTAQIDAATPNLQAYYKLNSDVTDATANANNLTASGSPTYSTDVPYPSPTTRLDIDQSATTSGQTYTLATAISEAAADKKSFTPAKDPQKSIAVLVAAKGSGDWTLTVHDSNNNSIASATITNANLIVGYTEFVFSSVWRPLLNVAYHFHVTSTVADGTVTTTVLNDLSTVSYRSYFQFLVEDTEWHPVAPMLTFLVIGNERYIAKYEATLYYPNQITLPAGWRVRCFSYWREFLVIGAMKGSAITSNDMGRLYFWDGIAPTYNFFIDVPEGGINAMLGTKGKLLAFAGYRGDLIVYQGGDYAEKLRRMPLLAETTYAEIYPGAMTMWNSLTHFGLAGATDSAAIGQGVYSYGSINKDYANSLSFDYPISTGNYLGTGISIGAVTAVNRKLLIAWKDNVSYGVDYVDKSNNPYPTGSIEFLIFDDGAVWKEKTALTVAANFVALNSGESIDVGFKIDRASSYTKLGAVTTSGDSVARLLPNPTGGRHKEFQVSVDLATTTTTSPKLLSIAVEKDLNAEETRVG